LREVGRNLKNGSGLERKKAVEEWTWRIVRRQNKGRITSR
jgi:hypothetical protein